MFACIGRGGHNWRSALLLQGKRVLPHIRDQVRVGQSSHLLDPLHHRVPEEVAEVFKQGSRTARDVQPGHCQIWHPWRSRIPVERNVSAANQPRDCRLDATVLPSAEARDRAATVRESFRDCGWKTVQMVDLLCKEEVYGEVPERSWRHQLTRLQTLKNFVCIFPTHLSPNVNNKHHICDWSSDNKYSSSWNYLETYLAVPEMLPRGGFVLLRASPIGHLRSTCLPISIPQIHICLTHTPGSLFSSTASTRQQLKPRCLKVSLCFKSDADSYDMHGTPRKLLIGNGNFRLIWSSQGGKWGSNWAVPGRKGQRRSKNCFLQPGYPCWPWRVWDCLLYSF